MANKTEKALEAARDAAKRAREGAKTAVAQAGQKLSQARQAIKGSKHRRKIEAVEVMAGSLTAAAAHAMDITVEYGDYEIPAGVVGGAVIMGAGMATSEPDAEALGFGGLVYGLSRFAEDKLRAWNNESDDSSGDY